MIPPGRGCFISEINTIVQAAGPGISGFIQTFKKTYKEMIVAAQFNI